MLSKIRPANFARIISENLFGIILKKNPLREFLTRIIWRIISKRVFQQMEICEKRHDVVAFFRTEKSTKKSTRENPRRIFAGRTNLIKHQRIILKRVFRNIWNLWKTHSRNQFSASSRGEICENRSLDLSCAPSSGSNSVPGFWPKRVLLIIINNF